ncbi:MAG: hypothetical protein NTW29_04945 [Bacteroidetes bacterium]|nr:hypothetical protein [Bacteroidota bacterium]
MWNNIYLAVILIAVISSLNAFRLDMARPYKQFSVFIFFVFAVEACAVAWPRLVSNYHWDYSNENHWIYNIYLLPAYLFYLYFYYNLLSNLKIKKAICYAGVVFFLTGLANLIFGQGLFTLNTYTVLAGGLLVVLLSISYFLEVIHSQDIRPLSTNALFWISSGAFLFHLTALLGLFFIIFLNHWYGRAAHATIMIIKITSILMYLFYSIAFLCQKKAS